LQIVILSNADDSVQRFDSCGWYDWIISQIRNRQNSFYVKSSCKNKKLHYRADINLVVYTALWQHKELCIGFVQSILQQQYPCLSATPSWFDFIFKVIEIVIICNCTSVSSPVKRRIEKWLKHVLIHACNFHIYIE
jgi:hypothetical protein